MVTIFRLFLAHYDGERSFLMTNSRPALRKSIVFAHEIPTLTFLVTKNASPPVLGAFIISKPGGFKWTGLNSPKLLNDLRSILSLTKG